MAYGKRGRPKLPPGQRRRDQRKVVDLFPDELAFAKAVAAEVNLSVSALLTALVLRKPLPETVDGLAIQAHYLVRDIVNMVDRLQALLRYGKLAWFHLQDLRDALTIIERFAPHLTAAMPVTRRMPPVDRRAKPKKCQIYGTPDELERLNRRATAARQPFATLVRTSLAAVRFNQGIMNITPQRYDIIEDTHTALTQRLEAIDGQLIDRIAPSDITAVAAVAAVLQESHVVVAAMPAA